VIGHQHQWYGCVSYAQHGDDMAVLNVFHRLGVERGTYVDVGAHHPFELSNTALLYVRGWRGVNVEANPNLIQSFIEHRPYDRTVQAAVVGEGSDVGQVVLYLASETSGVNSTVRSNMADHGIVDEVSVPTTTLSRVVREHCDGVWPDLVSIDAEGRDLEILSGILPRPMVLLVEAVSQGGDASGELRRVAESRGYDVHSWCGHNALLVRRDLMERLR